MAPARAVGHNKGQLLGVLPRWAIRKRHFKNTWEVLNGVGVTYSLCDPWAVEFKIMTTVIPVAGNGALWDSCWRTVRVDKGHAVSTLALC